MQQTSLRLFGLVIKLGVLAMIVAAILAIILMNVDGESLRIFNSIFQIIP